VPLGVVLGARDSHRAEQLVFECAFAWSFLFAAARCVSCRLVSIIVFDAVIGCDCVICSWCGVVCIIGRAWWCIVFRVDVVVVVVVVVVCV